MRKTAAFIMSLLLAVLVSGCAGQGEETEDTREIQETSAQSDRGEETSEEEVQDSGGEETMGEEAQDKGESRVLVAYFSATGTTKAVAEQMGEILGADLFEIIPVEEYSSEDLNYNDDNCRANQEQQDAAFRPEIAETVENIEDYDVIFVGHPIWWGEEPRIIDTFLESYDFSGKTMVDFCTSGGSGISGSERNLQEICSEAEWLPGRRFSGGADEEEIREWIAELNLDV